MKWSLLLLFCAASLAVEGSAASEESQLPRPDLLGQVSDESGKPIAGADVMIDSASVKKGSNPLCPSCYADCAKRAVTDYEGHFTLSDLDPTLRFNVLVVAEGFRPQILKKTDPAKGVAKISLKRLDLKNVPPSQLVRGRVVDEKGHPVAGATLTPSWFHTEKWKGVAPGVFDPLVVSNAKGEFVITSQNPIEFVQFLVKARGLAPFVTEKCYPEKADQIIKMSEGASIQGRVLHQGKPVPDVSIGLVQVDRSAMTFTGELSVKTNAQGEFSFENVAQGQEYFVYGLMDGLKSIGCLPVEELVAKTGQQEVIVPPLQVRPFHRLSGRVVLSDGSALPEHTVLMISRDQAWDHQQIELESDGSFNITGLPKESYSLSLRVPGFYFSPRLPSLDLYNDSLIGLIDTDIKDLLILMEKEVGPKKPLNYQEITKSGWSQEVVKASRLQGARMEEVLSLLDAAKQKP